MVAQLNKPRGGGGGGRYSSRALVMPLAAFTMACILYAYSVTSIRAAKRNAQLHREADGGQLDMRKESLRRHGILDKVEGTRGIELFRDARPAPQQPLENNKSETVSGANKARPLGDLPTEEMGASSPRTEVEGGLEGYKGVGAAVKKFKEIQSE